MRVIAYEVGGKLEICHPVLGSRFVTGVYDIETKEIIHFDTPIHFDRAVAAYGGSLETFDEEICVLKPIWSESEEEFVERIKGKDLPKGATNVTLIEPRSLPKSRVFRNAWMIEDGAIHVNMKAARILHMMKIRMMRNLKLKELDVAYMRADESGDERTKKEIVQEKQRLRNLPRTFDLEKARTPEQLEFLWPDNLDKPRGE